MSVLHTNNITNYSGTGGPTIAGITTVSSTGFMKVPVGNQTERWTRGIISDGLVFHTDFSFKESQSGVGTSVYDLTNYQNEGLMYSDVSYSDLSGGSLNFTGSASGNNKVVFEYSPYLQIGGPITISAWIYKNNNGMIVSSATYYGLFGSYYWGWDGNPNWMYYYFPVSVPSGAWCHLCVTNAFDGTTAKVYINGVGYDTIPSNPNLPKGLGYGSQPLTIGEYSVYAPYSPFSGNISQVSIYNRALTESEVLQNYEATKGRYL